MKDPLNRLGIVLDSVPLLLSYVDAEQRYRFNNKQYAHWFGWSPEDIVGRHVREIVGEEAYRVVRPHMEAALAGERVAYETLVPYAGAGPRRVATEMIPDVAPDGTVRGFVAVVQDVTERWGAEDKLRDLAAQHAVLIAAQQETVGGGNLDALLGAVVHRAREITGADGAVVEMVEGDTLVYRAASGDMTPHLGLRLSLGASYSGRCVREGQPLSCPDAEADPSLDQILLRRLGIRAFIVVPLLYGGRAVGVLKATSSHPYAFGDDTVTLLQLMGSVLVAALSGAAEAEARQALSQGEARQRLFLRDVLLSVTGGRLRLCDSSEDLPPALAPTGDAISLSRGASLADLRQRVRETSAQVGLIGDRACDLLTAAGEASMNAVVHAGQGIAQVGADASGMVQIRIEDWGEGIAVENLPKATLARGYTTAGTLGHGFKMMLQTVDRIFLLTGRTGTTVVLEQDRDEPDFA